MVRFIGSTPLTIVPCHPLTMNRQFYQVRKRQYPNTDQNQSHQPGQDGDGQAIFNEVHDVKQALARFRVLPIAEADGVVGRAHHQEVGE